VVGYQCFGRPWCWHLSLHPEDGGSMDFKRVVSCHITTWCHNSENHNIIAVWFGNTASEKFIIKKFRKKGEKYYSQGRNPKISFFGQCVDPNLI
jgi:hypothetical protein